MFSEFLREVLTKSGHKPDGCGMSARPEYYSGYPATTSNLDSEKLEKIWTAIKDHHGEEAAEAFVRMVEAIRVMTATDFLLTLAAFDANGFKWDNKLLSKTGGCYATSPEIALYTVFAAPASRGVDETVQIKNPFLRNHGRKVKDFNPYIQYGW